MILSPLPTQWTFWDYFVETNNPIEAWHQSLSYDARYLFDNILKDISKTEIPIQWGGWRGFLQGQLKSERIWELGFRADKRQYRIFGKFGNQNKQVVLLMGCYHKGRNYTPTAALDTAYKRAVELREGKASLHERKINANF
jgi:hypothetical protein